MQTEKVMLTIPYLMFDFLKDIIEDMVKEFNDGSFTKEEVKQKLLGHLADSEIEYINNNLPDYVEKDNFVLFYTISDIVNHYTESAGCPLVNEDFVVFELKIKA